MEKIEKPKVFVSYAWGSEDYQEKVLYFCSQLRRDGIDVILDKWNMREGNDTYAFMEQCVKDESITNVLMLLDPIYAKKSNEYKGGVGVETQIISPEVYQEVNQHKFLPVVFKRTEMGEVCKPVYLKTRLHFDLSLPEKYDYEYKRLVRTLYGELTYPKPELGERPQWVDEKLTSNYREVVKYQSIKYEGDKNGGSSNLRKYLEILKKNLSEYSNSENSKTDDENIIEMYSSLKPYRNDFFMILKNSDNVIDRNKEVAYFFEKLIKEFPVNDTLKSRIVKTFLHEIFIYNIAYYLRNNDYESVGYFLSKSYYNSKAFDKDKLIASYCIFYTFSEHERLDRAINKRDNKEYFSGTAKNWMDNIDMKFCSKDDFILADLICYNYGVYGKYFNERWKWFPITYIYDSEFKSVLTEYGARLISKEWLNEMNKIFSYDTVDEFIEKFKEVENNPEKNQEYRYMSSFASARVLGDFIKSEKIGTRR